MNGEPVGVLNIDKPAGLTSHDVVARVRRLSGVRRVGHAGTLDPLATGVLLVCVGTATRIAEYLQASVKTYLAEVRLGEETNTYDAEGVVVASHSLPPLTAADLQQVLKGFTGEISQTPPPYSAVKKQGRPAYVYARAGAEVELAPRQVTLFELDLVSWQAPHLVVRMLCSPGTYVRSLAHDLGQTLGCGGHVTSLRRLASGPWKVEKAVPLDDLVALGGGWTSCLHEVSFALSGLPSVQLEADEAYRFSLGQPRPLPESMLGRPGGEPCDVTVYDPHGVLLGIGRSNPRHGLLLPHKVFAPPVPSSASDD